MTAVAALRVSVSTAALVGSFAGTAVRASDGRSVPFVLSAGRWVFTLPGTLEVADAVILRPW